MINARKFHPTNLPSFSSESISLIESKQLPLGSSSNGPSPKISSSALLSPKISSSGSISSQSPKMGSHSSRLALCSSLHSPKIAQSGSSGEPVSQSPKISQSWGLACSWLGTSRRRRRRGRWGRRGMVIGDRKLLGCSWKWSKWARGMLGGQWLVSQAERNQSGNFVWSPVLLLCRPLTTAQNAIIMCKKAMLALRWRSGLLKNHGWTWLIKSGSPFLPQGFSKVI